MNSNVPSPPPHLHQPPPSNKWQFPKRFRLLPSDILLGLTKLKDNSHSQLLVVFVLARETVGTEICLIHSGYSLIQEHLNNLCFCRHGIFVLWNQECNNSLVVEIDISKRKIQKQSCIILKLSRGVGSWVLQSQESFITHRRQGGHFGSNCTAHGNIMTPSLPPPCIQTNKAAKLQMPFTAQSISFPGSLFSGSTLGTRLLPSQVYGVFLWGLSINTKRSISKELSFCTQKLLDGNHVKLESRAYS